MKRYRKWLAVGTLLALSSGCAIAPPANPWDEVDADTEPAAEPLELGLLPTGYTDDDAGTVTLTLDEAKQIEQYTINARANTALAAKHAERINVLKQEREALRDMGQAQRNIAEMRADILREERRSHFIQSIALWTGMIIAAGAAIGL